MLSHPTSKTSLPPSRERRVRVVVVTADGELGRRMRAMLELDGYEYLGLGDADELMRVCAEFEPDVVLMSAELPDATGPELCGEVRAADPARHTAIVLLHAGADEPSVAAGLLAGADDFVTNLDRVEELRARIHVQLRHKRMIDTLNRVRNERDLLRRDAHSDPLTGLANRRALERSVVERCESGTSFGVLFMDIDHFKRINDSFGHALGDQVLVAVAEVLTLGLRPGDLVARYGGEEFVGLIAGAGPESARLVAERLRRSVEELPPFLRGPASVNISIGAAVFDAHRFPEGPLDVLRRADAALYQAKRTGRNRVVLMAPEERPFSDEEATVRRARVVAGPSTTQEAQRE